MSNEAENDTSVEFDVDATIEDFDNEFGAIPIETIQTVPEDPYEAASDETVFWLEGGILGRMVRVLAVSASNASLRYCLLNITESTLTACTYNHICYGKFTAQLFQKAQNIENSITLVVPFSSLKKAAFACGPLVRFVLRPQGRLHVMSDGFERPLQVVDSKKFVGPRQRLGADTQPTVVECSTSALHDGLKFVFAFTESRTKTDYPVIQCKAGSVWARTSTAIAMAQVPKSPDLAFIIKVDHVKATLTALEELLVCERVLVGQDNGYTVFQGTHFTFGVEAALTQLAGIQFDTPSPEDKLLVPSVSLSGAMTHLMLTDSDEAAATTTLTVKDTDHRTRLQIITTNSNRETTRIDIPGGNLAGSPNTQSWRLPSVALHKAAQAAIRYRQANVELFRETSDKGVIYWTDFEDHESNLQRRVYMAPGPQRNKSATKR